MNQNGQKCTFPIFWHYHVWTVSTGHTKDTYFVLTAMHTRKDGILANGPFWAKKCNGKRGNVHIPRSGRMSRRLRWSSIHCIFRRPPHSSGRGLKRISKQMIQVGIISIGAGCADPRFPALYTRVTKVRQHVHYQYLLNINMRQYYYCSVTQVFFKGDGLDQESNSQPHCLGQ